ncbi:MAG TPA: hypothetical protein VHW90_04945 [Stellaceae bacterium]|jgi:hypothetical protein|nr:hypothetical protein [Stellaceae bacterium]
MFSQQATTATRRISLAFGLLLLLSPAQLARADDAPAAGCYVDSVNIPDQNAVLLPGQTAGVGGVTIVCNGTNEAIGRQIADIASRIVKERLDPQMVIGKLDEVNQVPAEGVARTVSDDQRQTIIKSLLDKPAAQIGVTAHPSAEDGADFAKALATSLQMVGWKIEGNQIRRMTNQVVDQVRGLAIFVRNKDAAPAKALQLRTALAAAHIPAALVSDPTLASDAAVLWIGRRPVFTEAPPQ